VVRLDWNFVAEGPVTNIVRGHPLDILHEDNFYVTAQFLVYFNRI